MIVDDIRRHTERLKVADSASSTNASEADIREDCNELANDRKGR